MTRGLLVLGNALRAQKARRRRLVRIGCGMLCGIAALGGTIAWPPAPRLVWNASASAPVGLYLVRPGGAIAVGDMVLAWPPEGIRAIAAARGYLPLNVPLVKRVAAGPGDTICAAGRRILLEGRAIAIRRARDARGRVLPRWTGCRTLRAGDHLLLMTGHPGSFDGRYFGVSRAADIIGPARLLWRR
ncbi:S26 family signal peptidase [Sphingomonas colocasiae]|uniref:S26 family signal peptidase n=1 Tax=Sphingomonas colocasiae TaxID=1848973 RepID=A0ABS7PPG0_9SPHN|nr:S26 family signal peptidase [Sphingomonas colocasiae]MBY8823205.1 S26 family signal peptidase [Sphingomonas colocasiae]